LVGASHTFTDAAYLSDYLLKEQVDCSVVAIPCTIDNNIYEPRLE